MYVVFYLYGATIILDCHGAPAMKMCAVLDAVEVKPDLLAYIMFEYGKHFILLNEHLAVSDPPEESA
jgi:hypothetical protein